MNTAKGGKANPTAKFFSASAVNKVQCPQFGNTMCTCLDCNLKSEATFHLRLVYLCYNIFISIFNEFSKYQMFL